MSLERNWLRILTRAGCGLTIGVFSAVCQISLVEINPSEITGFFGSLHQFTIALGIVFPYAIGIRFDLKGIAYSD
jgi:MFS family permease